MFSQLADHDLGYVLRGLLVVLATLALAPGAVLALILLAFVMSPAALVGIPFIVPALFPGASREHADAVRRSSYYPSLHEAALAH
jgi:hypothetical protein